MATFHGSAGQVYVSANQVAEVTEFSFEETAEFAEDTTLADTAKTTHATAITSARGSVTCWWDDTDTNGQEALDIGASLTLNLRPEGTGSGLNQISLTARITGASIQVQRGAILTRSFQFESSGAITRTAQA